MLRLGVSLTILIVVSNFASTQSRSQAQQDTVQYRQGGASIEDACRQELRQICSVGFPPNVSLVHRCIVDNQDKLSAPCKVLFRERQKSMTHPPG
jgi:hypothetical protein